MSSNKSSSKEYFPTIKECQEFLASNEAMISSFIFKYFEIESLLTAKFPKVKKSPSSYKSEIETSKIKKKFNWDYELVNRVFFGKEGTVPKTCRLLRNLVVHNHKKRLDAFNEIVQRYDELMEDMETLEELILNEPRD